MGHLPGAGALPGPGDGRQRDPEAHGQAPRGPRLPRPDPEPGGTSPAAGRAPARRVPHVRAARDPRPSARAGRPRCASRERAGGRPRHLSGPDDRAARRSGGGVRGEPPDVDGRRRRRARGAAPVGQARRTSTTRTKATSRSPPPRGGARGAGRSRRPRHHAGGAAATRGGRLGEVLRHRRRRAPRRDAGLVPVLLPQGPDAKGLPARSGAARPRGAPGGGGAGAGSVRGRRDRHRGPARVLLDLNAWPSFALFREEAAERIAAHLERRFTGGGRRS